MRARLHQQTTHNMARIIQAADIRNKLQVIGGKGYLFAVLNYGFHTIKDGNRIYHPVKVKTGVVIDPSQWDRPAKGNGEPWFTPTYMRQNLKQYNANLALIEAIKEGLFVAYKEALAEAGGFPPAPDQVLRKYRKDEPEILSAMHLPEYIRHYAQHHASPRTIRKYGTLANVITALEEARTKEPLKQWCKGSGKIYVSSFSRTDFNDLSAMIDHATKLIPNTFKRYGVDALTFAKEGTAYSSSTKNKFQGDMLNVLRYAKKDGHKVNLNMDELQLAPRIAGVKEFLMPEEMNAWINSTTLDGQRVELPPGEENVRRLFILGCMTGCRFDDLTNLLSRRIETIKGTEITFEAITHAQRKTKAVVCIPLFHWAKEMLKMRPTSITNQRFNDHLKQIAKRFGFDRPQHIVIAHANGRKEAQVVPLHEVISSHAMRRTNYTTLTSILFVPRQLSVRATGHSIGIEERGADLVYGSLTPMMAAEAILLAAKPRAYALPYQLYTDAVAIQLGVDETAKGRAA